jgi:hypothetical protein
LKDNFEKNNNNLTKFGVSLLLSAAASGSTLVGNGDKKVSAVVGIGTFVVSFIAQTFFKK